MKMEIEIISHSLSVVYGSVCVCVDVCVCVCGQIKENRKIGLLLMAYNDEKPEEKECSYINCIYKMINNN